MLSNELDKPDLCSILEHIYNLNPGKHYVSVNDWDVFFKVGHVILGSNDETSLMYCAEKDQAAKMITIGGYSSWTKESGHPNPVVGAPKQYFWEIANSRLEHGSVVLIPALVKLADRTNYKFNKP